MITAGPPSVAILVAAALPSSGSRSGAGTAGAEPLAAGSADVSAIAATTSTSATGTSVPTGPDGVPVVASVAGAGCLSSMLRAATLSGSAGLSSAAVPACSAISGTAAERSSSRGFSAAGRSTRSRARLGIGSSFSLAKTGSGGARRDGRLANSSCAARNKAAAPSPNTRIDIERTIAVNRKRKPGSMDASSALL